MKEKFIIDLKELKKYILKNVGKKCEEHSLGCIKCQIWRIYEDLKSWEDLIKP